MAISPCASRADEQGKEMVQHGTTLFPVACYHDDLTHDPVPWHWHEELESAVVTQGSCVFATNNVRVTLKKGEGVLLNVSVLHSCFVQRGAGRLHSIVFHPRLIGGSSGSIFYEKYVLPVTLNPAFTMRVLKPSRKADAHLIGLLEEAWHACEEEPYGYELRMRDALSGVMLKLTETLPQKPAVKAGAVRRNEERLKAMLEYIRVHLSEEMTLSDIAEAAAVSESECIRCFRRTIGTSPIQYVKQLRLQKAAELLRTTSLSITEIALDCGFREMSYFTRAFKAQFQKTPSAYR